MARGQLSGLRGDARDTTKRFRALFEKEMNARKPEDSGEQQSECTTNTLFAEMSAHEAGRFSHGS